MKSFTKLTVLLLTLALLLGSVFAVTAFAADPEVATATNEAKTPLHVVGDDGVATAGKYSGSRIDNNKDGSNWKKYIVDSTTGKITFTNTTTAAPTAATSSSYVNFRPATSFELATIDYLALSVNIGTDNAYLSSKVTDKNGLVHVGFTNRNSAGGSVGAFAFYIVTVDGKVYLANDQKGEKKYCQVDNDFQLDVVIDMDANKAYGFVDGALAFTRTGVNAASAIKCDELRISIYNNDSTDDNRTTKEESVWFKNLSYYGVTNSSADIEGDVANLLTKGNSLKYKGGVNMPLSNWKNNGTYTYANAETVTANANTFGVKYAADGGEDIYVELSMANAQSVFKSANDVNLTLLEDLTFTKTMAGSGANAQFNGFDISTDGTKTLNLNGFTFYHLPLSYGASSDNELQPARGQTFSMSGQNKTIDIVINGNGGKIVKRCSANDLFKHSSAGLTSTITLKDVTIDIAGGSVIFGNYGRSAATGNNAGTLMNVNLENVIFDLKKAPTNYENSSGTPAIKFNGLAEGYGLEEKRATVTIKGTTLDIASMNNVDFTCENSTLCGGLNPVSDASAFIAQVTDSNVEFKNCELHLGGYTITNTTTKKLVFNGCQIKTSGSKAAYVKNVDVDFIDCTIGIKGVVSEVKADAGETTVDYSNCKFYKIDGANIYAPVGTTYNTTTFHEGVKMFDKAIVNGNKYLLAEGCYVAANTDADKDAYPYVVKKLDFSALKPMANLTLYTDINYNIYLPVDEAKVLLTKVNDTALDKLEQITDNATGKVYYIITEKVAIHEANKSIEISFTPVNAGSAVYNLKKTVSVTDYISTVYGDAKYADSFALMSDLVDYADEAITYFGGAEDNEFAALKDLDNYKTNANEEIPATTTDRSGLSGYIANSYLNLEKSNVKFVFTVATAGEYTVSYESADGTIVTTTDTYAEGENIEVAMRAYDLNAVITITTGTATGTYDLAAYAADVKDVNAEAYALVLEMYNYAVSAKAYKFPENN